MKKATLSFVFCLSIFCSSVKAETAKTDLSKLFDADIFSLAKKKESAFDASSSVYVLSGDDIRRSGATSVPEALRLIPGLQVARSSGNAWSISARGLNHQFASKLLVLVDGLTSYTSIFSGTFWDNIDYVLDDIDRIEVIRGPGGSIWGANAMNGIINIITKNSAQTQGGYIGQTFGNIDNSITEVRYGGKTKDFNSYRFYAKSANRDGMLKMNDERTNVDLGVNNKGSRSNNDGTVNNRAGFRYDLSSIKNNVISVHGDVFDNTSKNYFQGFDSRTDKVNSGGNLVVNWNKTISRKSNFSLQTYAFFDRNNIGVVDYKEQTYDVDFQHFYDFSDNNNFIWGLGYRNIQDHITSNPSNGYLPIAYYPNKRNIETYNAFLQDKIALIPNDLFLTLGSKFEHNDQTGMEYQPNARLTYYPSRDQTLWSAVSRAVRIPTRGEDSIDIRIAPAPGTTVTKGSGTSSAETVVAYEAGYRIKPTFRTLFDISVYYNEYSRLGNFDADVTNGSPGTPTASNTGRASTFGGEITIKWQPTTDLKLELGYDYLNADIKLNAQSNENDANASALNADLLRYFENMSPKNQFRIRAFYDISPKWEFDNMFYYVDYLKGRETYEADVPAYIRWDTRLGYLVNKNLDLSVGIQNILDDRHNEFGPALFNNRVEVPRTYYGKAVFRF